MTAGNPNVNRGHRIRDQPARSTSPAVPRPSSPAPRYRRSSARGNQGMPTDTDGVDASGFAQVSSRKGFVN